MTDRKTCTIALVTMVVFALSPVCMLGAKKPTLNKRLAKITQKKKALVYKIKLKDEEKRTEMGRLAVVEQHLEDAQDKLTSNSTKLQSANTDLNDTIRRLVLTKRQLARRQTLLQRRIVDIYEGDDLNYIDVVLGSTNMWTFLSRTYYLQQILHADTTLITQIRDDKEQIEKDKARQAQRVSEISSLRVQLISDRDEVAQNASAKEKQIREIENDKDRLEQALAELERESQAIEDQIRRIENTPAGIKRSARVFRGGLMLPVSGRITSTFGYRVHPITGVYKLHTGIDISVPTGTPVHAAADGTVIVAGRMPAYGLEVVIDHGGHISTLYGHNSRLLVRVGEDVKCGQVIAKSGSTGYSTGPHCHFEKRDHGKPVNPR